MIHPNSQSLSPPSEYKPAPPAGAEPLYLQEVLRGTEVIVDGSKAIHPAQVLYPTGRINIEGEKTAVSVVAEIGIPNGTEKAQLYDRAVILRLFNRDGTTSFGIQGISEGGRSEIQPVGIPPIILPEEGGVQIGRVGTNQVDSRGVLHVSRDKIWGGQFDLKASRTHVLIEARNGELSVTDLATTNGTLFAGYQKPDPNQTQDIYDDPHDTLHTVMLVDRAERKGVAFKGYFADRPIITRDTFPVEGGVDIRSWGDGEAIVIDSKHKAVREQYNLLWSQFEGFLDASTNKGLTSEAGVLTAIQNTVIAAMKYDLDWVNEFAATLPQGDTDHRKVNLKVYLAEGKGVCRHMALAAAWLGGEAYARGLLQGKTTAEVNQRKKDNSAHEWARYTAPSGQVYIIDPAYKYLGALEKSGSTERDWHYYRPGEKKQYLANIAAKGLVAESFDAPKATLRERIKRFSWGRLLFK